MGDIAGNGQQGGGALAVGADVEAAPLGLRAFDGDDAAEDIEPVFFQGRSSWRSGIVAAVGGLMRVLPRFVPAFRLYISNLNYSGLKFLGLNSLGLKYIEIGRAHV